MSKLANKSLIGAFVIGAIALAVIAVIIFGSGKFLRKTQEYVMFFGGSVKGLSVGSPVIFRGVKIGEVENISMQLREEDLTYFIPVVVEIDMDKVSPTRALVRPYQYLDRLISKGLRAQLQSQSFVTGQLAVALDFFPDKPAKFVGLDKKYHEIPTVPTTLEDLAKTLQNLHLEELVENVKSAVAGIDRVVNSPEIPKMLQSLSQRVEETGLLVRNIDSQLGPLISSLDGTVKDVQKFVQHVDTRIDPVFSRVEGVLQAVENLTQNDVQKLVRDVNQLVPEVSKILGTLQATLEETKTTISSIEGTAGPNSVLVYELTETLEEVSNTARSLRNLTDYLQQHPEALIRGKKNP